MSDRRINELAEQVFKHRNLYYNRTPVVSDTAFDILVDELKELSPDHPAITDIGSPVEATEWKKGKHSIPMGSLDKARNPEEISSWITDTFNDINSIFVIEKLDGSSLEVIYEDGKFVEALTRGDGTTGELVGRNVVKMNGVKSTLPLTFTGSLRGEIILRRSNLHHFPDIVSARNGANGIAKRISGEGVEHLDVIFYQAIGDLDFDTEEEQLNFIKNELELQTPNYGSYKSASTKDLTDFVISKWNEYQQGIRDGLDWDIDGLVVNVNDLRAQTTLGEHRMRPKGKRAFKFPAPEARTRILNIRSQVGNGGRITPVVDIEPVELADAMISKASIYNFGYIQEMGIDIGAEVMVKRGGDIIPVISEVIMSTNTTFKTPTECPVCSGPIEQHGEHLQCINTDTCPALVEGRIKNWVNGLNILELGEALISKLVELKLVSTVVDLYRLSIDDLSSIDRMGKKSATNVYNSIRARNPIPLEMFLGSLSIPNVGSNTIKLLMDAGLDTLDKIMKASYDTAKTVKGLGPVKSRCLIDGIERNKNTIIGLLEAGLKIEEKKAMSGKLSGKSFVITGKTNIKRDLLKEMIEENGGVYKAAVRAGSTNYLIIADPSSTTVKANSARDMGVELISEEQFLAMVEW